MNTLPYNKGFWWYRASDATFHACLILADWDSADNYEKVTDEWKRENEPQPDPVEITDTEALTIIADGYDK